MNSNTRTLIVPFFHRLVRSLISNISLKFTAVLMKKLQKSGQYFKPVTNINF